MSRLAGDVCRAARDAQRSGARDLRHGGRPGPRAIGETSSARSRAAAPTSSRLACRFRIRSPTVRRSSGRPNARSRPAAISTHRSTDRGPSRKTSTCRSSLFTYVNPVLRMGTDVFVDRAADAGVDGVLLLDLPIEESADDARKRSTARGIDQIFLVSPTTTDERLREAGAAGDADFCTRFRGWASPGRASVGGRHRRAAGRAHSRDHAAARRARVWDLAAGPRRAKSPRFADAAVVGSAIVQVDCGRARPTARTSAAPWSRSCGG